MLSVPATVLFNFLNYGFVIRNYCCHCRFYLTEVLSGDTLVFVGGEKAIKPSAPQGMAMSETEKTALEVAREKMEVDAKGVNDARSGKGTRVKVGSTRGKNPQAITFEAFDLSKSETLPSTISEFMEVTKVQDEPTIMSYLIDGFNDAMYTAASDPVAEFIDASWPDDVQKQFRLVVRNYANATGVSIEDAVALIKPGISASQKKA